MKTFTGIVMLMLLLAACISAMPQRRHRQQKSQRQVELASTPYPAAGFRPKIPFELPSEQQPKVEVPTTAATFKIAAEEAPSTTELIEQQPEQEPTDVEVNPRTPAATYGAPEQADDTVEVVGAPAPAQDFQPPVREAVEDFAAVAIDGVADEQQPVADLPALDKVETPLNNEDEQQTETDTEVAAKTAQATPANTYGAPNTPADNYGPPELEEPIDNELDVEESQVELVEEAEQELINEEEVADAAALNLSSGRLILLPLNAAGTRFGRLILAVEQPRQPKQQLGRQRIRSERLRRRN
ncbi:uncharacterized protein LOC6558094 [Drosophila grimshawi]|uniref:GH16372 n=1 Tax=Drosophila grimshawi TaxID=7222 RepID=B4IZ92_DROGR|nr:uncharacterized protein LOC6558094 [Drosophila grimshawi]EDV96647.1 GH16372 [Drosophila grimshawi]